MKDLNSFSFCRTVALMYASVFGNLTVILQRLCVQSSKQHGDLHLIREFAKFHKIPTVLKEIMEDHVLQESLFVKADDLQTVTELWEI